MRQTAYLIILLPVLCLCFRPDAAAQTAATTEISVFAAASLNEAFSAMTEKFERANPDIKIIFNFAGSQQLVQQISQGAPFDMVALASSKQMLAAVKTGNIDTASITIFARNRLVLVFPKENPAGIHSLLDLSRPRTKLVFADKAVPAGQYTLDVLKKCDRSSSFDTLFSEKVLGNVVSYEENVKAVVSKIVLGEADAGIVYASDFSKSVSENAGMIAIPDSLNVLAEYPVALSRHARGEAGKFLKYVLSGEGSRILAQSRLIPPR